jgi:hypothetical protein
VKRFLVDRLDVERFSVPLFGSWSDTSPAASPGSAPCDAARLRFGFSGLVPVAKANLPTGNGQFAIELRGNGGLDLSYGGARSRAFTVNAGLRPLRDAYWINLRREF